MTGYTPASGMLLLDVVATGDGGGGPARAALVYCRVDGGLVVDRIVSQEPLPPEWFAEGETWIEDEAAQIGWAHDGEAFTPPAREPEPDPGPVLIPYGNFRARWEASEFEALFAAKNTDWRVEDYVTLASAQGHVNLSGETAAAAKALFVQMGVLSAERADIIFATD